MCRFRAALASVLAGLGLLGQAGLSHAAPASHKRLAVLELRGSKIDADVLTAFADALRGGAVDGLAGREVQVMTRENMMVLLRDMGKNECSEGECEVETARNIGADFVVSGAVVLMDSVFVVSLKLHETKGGRLLATDSVDAPSQIEILHKLRECAARLVGNIWESRAPVASPAAPAAALPTAYQPSAAPPPAELFAPPVADTTIHNHDGFYLRFSFGTGFAYDRLSGTDSDGAAMSGETLSGACLPFEIAIGGTLGRTVLAGVVGGSPMVSLSPSGPHSYPRSKYQHMFMLVGALVDFYPDTKSGTHFGAAVGLGGPTLSAPSGESSSSSSSSSSPGFGALVAAGHDFWVTDQWSMGASIRLAYSYGPDEYKVDHSVVIPSLVVNAVYH